MLNGLLYVVGHLVVAAVAYLFFYFLRREPNLAARREAIFELNHRPARIEAAEAEIAASRSENSNVERRTTEVRAVLVDHVPLDDPPATKWAFGALSIVLIELEAAVFFLLTAPSQLLGFPAETWAALAAPIAVAWVLILHVLMGAVVGDKHRPARTIRRAKIGAVLFGAGVVTAVWLVLSGRNTGDTSLIEELTAAGLMILAALLSVCGAFCSIVATTLFEAQRNERELERLQVRREAYARHLELVERDLSRLKTGPITSAPEQQSGVRSATAGAAAPGSVVATIMILLVLIGVPQISQAQSISDGPVIGRVAEARPASAIGFARAGACEIIADLTSSTEREALQQTLSKVSDQLPAIVKALGCTVLRLVPFAGDLFISIDEITLPVITDPAATCNGIKATSLSARTRAVELLYPRVADAHQQRAVDDCIAQRRATTEPRLNERSATLAQAGDRLRALGGLDPRGPCTALYQVMHRSMTRSQHQIVISDVTQTCAPPEAVVAVPDDARVLFLVIPPGTAGNSDRANLLLTRLAAIERAFPSARALLAPEATPAFWARLAETR